MRTRDVGASSVSGLIAGGHVKLCTSLHDISTVERTRYQIFGFDATRANTAGASRADISHGRATSRPWT